MIVVTGGAGFIGSVVVKKLNEIGRSDILIVDSLGSEDKWKNLVGKRYEDLIYKDDFFELLYHGMFKGITDIIHMGACSATTEKDADFLVQNNYHYTRNLAEWALENNVRLIYASSAATYGDGSLGYSDEDELTPRLQPLNMYGYSKQMMDEWVLLKDLQDKMVGLKFFNVFGPNEYHKKNMRSVVNKAFHMIKKTGEMSLFKSYDEKYENGEQMRDFVYVNDCADIILWLIEHPEINGIYNIGTGIARTWVDLVKAVFSAMDKEEKIHFIEMPENLQKHYQYYTQADISKLKSVGCPVEFSSLEEAVKDYVQNYLMKSNPYK